MKIFKICLVIAVVLIQIAAIFWLSFEREKERDTAETFIMRCGVFDPRDWLRGHYLPLNFEIENQKHRLADVEKILYPEELKDVWKFFEDLKEVPEEFREWRYFYPSWEFCLLFEKNPENGFAEFVGIVPAGTPASPGTLVVPAVAKFVGWEFKDGGDADFYNGEVQIRFKSVSRRFYVSEAKAKKFDGVTKMAAEVYLRGDGSLGVKDLFPEPAVPEALPESVPAEPVPAAAVPAEGS